MRSKSSAHHLAAPAVSTRKSSSAEVNTVTANANHASISMPPPTMIPPAPREPLVGTAAAARRPSRSIHRASFSTSAAGVVFDSGIRTRPSAVSSPSAEQQEFGQAVDGFGRGLHSLVGSSPDIGAAPLAPPPRISPGTAADFDHERSSYSSYNSLSSIFHDRARLPMTSAPSSVAGSEADCEWLP